jgi:hypothetical protein
MDKLVISATGDIAEKNVEFLKYGLGYENCHKTTSKRVLLSATPPSFIEIAGSLISWETIWIASATVFFSTLSKQLAEDLYDHKKIFAEALFSPFLKVAKSIVDAIHDMPRNTFVRVAVSAPNGVPNPSISFLHESEEEVAFKLACFYAVADRIIERLIEVSEKYKGMVMPPVVSVSERGDVTVQCYAGRKNDRIEFTISLLNEF